MFCRNSHINVLCEVFSCSMKHTLAKKNTENFIALTESFHFFNPNTGKYGPEKTPYLGNFQAVRLSPKLKFLTFMTRFLEKVRPVRYA